MILKSENGAKEAKCHPRGRAVVLVAVTHRGLGSFLRPSQCHRPHQWDCAA